MGLTYGLLARTFDRCEVQIAALLTNPEHRVCEERTISLILTATSGVGEYGIHSLLDRGRAWSQTESSDL